MPDRLRRGKLVIISGPSGVGKGTVLRGVLERMPVPLVPSVSATTRLPRPGEMDGVHYHFMSEDRFEQTRREDGFIECFDVFGSGRWYGTLRETVQAGLDRGDWPLLEIDVQGALAVMDQYPEAISIFIQLDSLDELERRLRGRATENEQAVRQRLETAASEFALADRYRFQVENDQLDRAIDEVCEILARESQSCGS